jgi:hypothetical protein
MAGLSRWRALLRRHGIRLVVYPLLVAGLLLGWRVRHRIVRLYQTGEWRSRSVGDVLKRYEARARTRLEPRLAGTGVLWPPEELLLVAIGVEAARDVDARRRQAGVPRLVSYPGRKRRAGPEAPAVSREAPVEGGVAAPAPQPAAQTAEEAPARPARPGAPFRGVFPRPGLVRAPEPWLGKAPARGGRSRSCPAAARRRAPTALLSPLGYREGWSLPARQARRSCELAIADPRRRAFPETIRPAPTQ